MFRKTLQTLIAGAALLGPAFAHTAFAQDLASYPRVVGSGENASLEYGSGPHLNIVGGGAVVVTGSGDNVTLEHLEPSFAQAPRSGMLPVVAGSGENAETIWVPASEHPAHASVRVLGGQQG